MITFSENQQKIVDVLEAANKKEINEVLEQIKAEIYEEFMTIDGGVHDKSALKCMEIIDKYKAESEDKE